MQTVSVTATVPAMDQPMLRLLRWPLVVGCQMQGAAAHLASAARCTVPVRLVPPLVLDSIAPRVADRASFAVQLSRGVPSIHPIASPMAHPNHRHRHHLRHRHDYHRGRPSHGRVRRDCDSGRSYDDRDRSCSRALC